MPVAASERRRAPLAARAFAVDLIPSGAYWRDQETEESFYDFASVEAEEGRDIQGTRIRLGVILAAMMERHVDWIRALSPGRNPSPPAYFEREVGREFFRLSTLAWFRGTTDVRRTVSRALGEPQSPPSVVLSAGGVSRLEVRSYQTGRALCRVIADAIGQVAVSAFGPDGSRVKGPDELEEEVRTYYASSWITPGPRPDPSGPGLLELACFEDETVELAGRRMKVRDQDQYRRWQKGRIPFSKWIKQAIEDIEAENLAPPQITPGMARTWLVTERTRYRAEGAIAEAEADARIGSLMFSTMRDDSVCPKCGIRDKVIRPVGDLWWSRNRPPLHFRCRCDVIPVLRKWAKKAVTGAKSWLKVTPKRSLPKDDDLQPGFGSYDRSKVKTAKALGIRPQGPARR